MPRYKCVGRMIDRDHRRSGSEIDPLVPFLACAAAHWALPYAQRKILLGGKVQIPLSCVVEDWQAVHEVPRFDRRVDDQQQQLRS